MNAPEEEINEWCNNHNIILSPPELRAAYEDAATGDYASSCKLADTRRLDFLMRTRFELRQTITGWSVWDGNKHHGDHGSLREAIDAADDGRSLESFMQGLHNEIMAAANPSQNEERALANKITDILADLKHFITLPK